MTKVNSRRFGEVWGRTTERITRTLGDLIDSMVSYTLDFQFFVVSATGGLAKRPDGSVEPPAELHPYGIEVPLIWAFKRIIFNKRKYFWWHKVKWIMGLCIFWALLFSAINVWHVAFWYSDLERGDRKFYEEFPSAEKPLSTQQAHIFQDPFKEYLDHWAVSDFFGAHDLIIYANKHMREIQDSTDVTLASSPDDATGGGGGGGGAANSQASKSAVQNYNQIVDNVQMAPVGQRLQLYEQSMQTFWDNLGPVGTDSTSVSEGIVSSIKFYEKQYHSDWEEFSNNSTVTYEVTGLAEKERVTMQIDDGSGYDFVYFGEGNSANKLKRQVSGPPSDPIHFKQKNLVSGLERTQDEDDPLKNFYPVIKSGQGYRLHFGVERNIYIKWVEGTIPKPPKLSKL